MDQHQQGSRRRGHFHRGRRGPDRRPHGGQNQEAKPSTATEPQTPRVDHVDVEQIMRDIRARIAQRHGIELSGPQIRELAARRLEAILDPRNVDAALLEQLRKAAGEVPAALGSTPHHAAAYTFEDTTLYESSRSILTAVRRLLNPVLRLFFNPNPLVHALHTQVKINAEQAARTREHEARQAEWNALHFELLRRVVAESAKLSLELEALSLRVESLGARVDFADRRVREIESLPPRGGRPTQDPITAAAPATGGAPAQEGTASAPTQGSSDALAPDGQRRRRRRRRGRRSGVPMSEGVPRSADDAPGSEDALASEDGDVEAGDAFADEPALEAQLTGAAYGGGEPRDRASADTQSAPSGPESTDSGSGEPTT